MTKLIVTSIIIFFGAINLTAGTGTSFSVTADDNNHIMINLAKDVQEEVIVTLSDRYGVKVFSEKTQSHTIKARKYDLSKLDNGLYTLELELEDEIKIQKINKSFNSIDVYEAEKSSVFKPIIKNNNGKVSVNVLSFHGSFQIKVINSKGDIMYKNKYQANGSFNSIYDLTTLPEGEYNIQVGIDVENYYGSFDKKVNVDSGIASL